MIKFYDPSGESHFGQATITRTTSVNGGLSLTGEVFAGDDVLNGLDYGWWLNFDNEKYVITYKKLSDDTNTIVFDAVQQFFWDFAKVALHSQYTGSHEYAFYLNQLFNGSGYTYKNDVTVPAFEKENWGYKNKLSLFNDIMDQADVEFEVHNETVHIAKQIGSDLTSFVRKGINLSDLTEEIKISDFATYAKGYGAFKDPQDPSKGRLEVEYRSELADKFGVLEMDPIVDERYMIADNLIAELKKHVDSTYTVSMTMNIYDLESAGYPNYESPKVGDWILAIDEALNFKRKIRIIKLEEQFDVIGKRIGYTATCGDLSIVDQYTNIQGSLDSKVQRIQESLDYVASSANGKNSNYYGAKEPASANDGDLWFDQSNSDPDKWSIKQWANGRWEQLTLNPGEVSAKVEVARSEAETAVNNAKSAADKADQLASRYDDTSSLANQALDKASSAQNDASSAVSKAESAASEFGRVDQKADSAQNAASYAVSKASSAAADSKDAKQIAGAVNQSYKTLTDGSTMTIAELESGLAVKLTKSDLNGYATETWAQNQINANADGINATLSSVKTTVDGQTTSINDLKADSSSFKSQFTTVNDILGKQTTDIGTLQASSKELTIGFDKLTTANGTNEHNISELKLSAEGFSSTLETVQTQVQNSAVGTNLLVGTSRDLQTAPDSPTKNVGGVLHRFSPDELQFLAGKQVTLRAFIHNTTTHTVNLLLFTSGSTIPFGVGTGVPAGTDGYSTIADYNISSSVPSGDISIRAYTEDTAIGGVQYKELKLEKGGLATDWCANPADNATVTALSSLSQTVDGMKADISKKIEQKDLNGYATETWAQNQVKMTAEGINGTLSSVKSTVDSHTTSINDLKADSSGFKAQFTTVNNTIGKHTTDIGTLQASNKSLSASFDSLNTDNNTNKHNISQLQASATTFNSTLMTVQQQVTDSAVGINLLRNARTLDGWKVWAGSGGGKGFNIEDKFSDSGQYRMAHIFNNVDGQNSDGPYWPGVNLFLNAGQVYTISIWTNSLGSSEQPVSWTLWLNWDKDHTYQGVSITHTTAPDWSHYSATFTATVGGQVNNVRIIPYFGTGAAANVGGSVYLLKPKLERGSRATDFSVNPADNATVDAVSSISQTVDAIQTTVRGKVDNDTYQSDVKQLSGQIESVVKKADDNFSAIQQTTSDINLRVEKKGVINAVNVSNEGIQIYGDKLHITAATYIDNAVIKDAMIESLNATKITVGTLDATKVNIIKLNANNITAGSIRGANLEIGLNSGNVEFQRGRIHSSDNTIDINIDNRYISVANGVNRVMLKNGEMQFVEPSMFDVEDSPYFRIHNRGGLAYGGAELVGRDYVAVSNAANSDDYSTYPIGVEEFSGLFTGYDRVAQAWRPTKLAGAERGVVISGGSTFDSAYMSASPHIIVGYDNTSKLAGGNRILFDAEYVHSFSTYKKTTSQAPNVYVAQDGALLRSTSASKYKTNIVRGYSTDYGNKLIQLPTATWIDKASLKRYNEDPSQPVPSLNYGMIAEDLAAAGLEHLVVRNDEGGLEGIQYDRIAVALLPLLAEWKQIIDNQEKEINELKNKKEQ